MTAEAEAGAGSHKPRLVATSKAGSGRCSAGAGPAGTLLSASGPQTGDDTRPLSPASPTVGLRCVAQGDPHTTVPATAPAEGGHVLLNTLHLPGSGQRAGFRGRTEHPPQFIPINNHPTPNTLPLGTAKGGEGGEEERSHGSWCRGRNLAAVPLA